MAAAPPEQLFASLAYQPHESCAFAYLSASGAVLGVRHTAASAGDQTEADLRSVAIDALELWATSVTMAHNHPSGDPTASASDYAVTRQLARGLALIGIRLAEHVIVAGPRSFSLRAAGLL